MTPQTEARLKAFLGALPGGIASRLAAAVEFDRLTGGEVFPHETMLAALRPALRGSEPPAPRTPTPLRLLCAAFEDALVERRDTKAVGRILRSSIGPLWRAVHADTNVRDAEARLRAAIVAGDAIGRTEGLAGLRDAVLHALDAAAADGALAQRAGSDAAADLSDIRAYLKVAPFTDAMREALPRRIGELEPAHLDVVREAWDLANEAVREHAPHVALLAIARLERPWQGLRLLGAISRQSTDQMIAATDLGIVGDQLFGDIENLASQIRATRPFDFDPEALTGSVAHFAELSAGLVRELGIRRDGRWGQRLMAARAGVAEAMESLIERAPREILGALPTHRVGGFAARGSNRPDVSRPPDPEKAGRAERFARLLAGCRPYAAQGAFGAALSDAMEQAGNALRSHGEELLRELRIAPPEQRDHAQAHLDVTAHLSEMLLGAEETDLLRRRGRAAAAG